MFNAGDQRSHLLGIRVPELKEAGEASWFARVAPPVAKQQKSRLAPLEAALLGQTQGSHAGRSASNRSIRSTSTISLPSLAEYSPLTEAAGAVMAMHSVDG